MRTTGPIAVREWADPVSWNAFASSVPCAHFQQSWEWGDLAAVTGGQAVRLAAIEGDRMVGAAQIFVHPLGRTPWTHLTVPRGPAVDAPSIRILGPLFDRARAVGRDVNALGMRVEPNAPGEAADWKASLGALGFHPMYPPSQPRSSWVLDITPDPDTLLAGMKQKTRYNIRLAERKGVEVTVGSAADIGAFYALLAETAARDDFFIHPRSFYESMFLRLWQTGRFRLLLARYRGDVIAGATFLRFGDTCWYMHGASGPHRDVMAPHLLQWEGITWAREEGCTLYDFRAVPDLLRPDQDMYGVYRFKEGFGGHQFTALGTHAAPYRPYLFALWRLYFSGRFALDAWDRRRRHLPARQFA